jgi:hypothetical protein
MLLRDEPTAEPLGAGQPRTDTCVPAGRVIRPRQNRCADVDRVEAPEEEHQGHQAADGWLGAAYLSSAFRSQERRPFAPLPDTTARSPLETPGVVRTALVRTAIGPLS